MPNILKNFFVIVIAYILVTVLYFISLSIEKSANAQSTNTLRNPVSGSLKTNKISTDLNIYEFTVTKDATSTLDGAILASEDLNANAQLTHVDRAGNVLFSKIYKNGSFLNEFFAVENTELGGFIAAGRTSVPTDNIPVPSTKGLIIKTDESGDIIWQKALSPTSFGGVNSTANNFSAIRETNDEELDSLERGYIAVGVSNVLGNGNALWVVKLDSHGNIMWENIYTGTNPSVFGSNDIRQTSDGGYIVMSPIVGPGFRVIKLDRFGNVEWDNVYGTAQHFSGGQVIETQDGDFATVGLIFIPGGEIESFLLRLRQDGTVRFYRTYSADIGIGFRELVEAGNGDIYIAGNSLNTVRYSTVGLPTTSVPISNILLVRVGGMGNVKKSKYFARNKTDELLPLLFEGNKGALNVVASATDFPQQAVGGVLTNSILVKFNAEFLSLKQCKRNQKNVGIRSTTDTIANQSVNSVVTEVESPEGESPDLEIEDLTFSAIQKCE